jgi:hypothetical protein
VTSGRGGRDGGLRIVLDSYLVHYPLGGMHSWVMQYLIGFQRLGHDVFFVEKSPYPRSCYDPEHDAMSDDCSRSVTKVTELMRRFGLGDRWCYVDSDGHHHGLRRARVTEVMRSADVFIEMGTYGHWLDDAAAAGLRVYLDAEPGSSQMLMERELASGRTLPDYDVYYTDGVNVGTPHSTAPTAGRAWRALYNPVVLDLFPIQPAPADAPFTTVMNWKAHRTMTHENTTYGQKDVEFEKFWDLPSRTRAPLEVAVSGKQVPASRLAAAGWRTRAANRVTRSVDSYWSYIRGSRGEFSVSKNVFVATNCGWFSDRSAVYLASGRPVVLQDTGFSSHLPCGQGLFAVRSVDEAAAALEEIVGDHDRHASRAREIAEEHLDARKVLGGLLRELGA